MNLALIGYGRMGKEVELVAKEKGVKIVSIFTEENNTGGLGLTPDSLKNVDVCVDFSTPGSIIDNIEAVADCRKNMIVGTTGWYDKLDQVRKLVKEKKIVNDANSRILVFFIPATPDTSIRWNKANPIQKDSYRRRKNTHLED